MKPLDHILDNFLKLIGITQYDALLHFNLAPLQTRRDMTALTVIHRALLHQGPEVLQKFFSLDSTPPRHSARLGQSTRTHYVKDLYEPLHRDYLNRSVLGYIWVYNLLPDRVVHATTTRNFQTVLQSILKTVADMNNDTWIHMYCPRAPRNLSPLRHIG